MAVPSTFADLNTTPVSNAGLVAESDSVSVIDNHFRTTYAMLASIYANSANGWTSPYLPKTGGTLTGNTTVSSGVFWVGDSSTNNSSDPMIVISRDVDASGSGNGHAYTDSSTINRTGTISYNSYDARVTFSGSYNYGHYAAFQVGPVFAGSGTVTDLFSFVASPEISSGTLTNYYGLIVTAPTVTGSGAVTNCYGMYAASTFGPSLSDVTGDIYFWRNDSDAKSYSVGLIQTASSLVAGLADTSYTPVKTIDAVTNSGTAVGLRLRQLANQFLDIEIPASQTYATISNAAGEVARIDASKNVIFTPPTTAPTLGANGQLVITPTSNTNLRFSYRGSDGVTRVANLTLA